MTDHMIWNELGLLHFSAGALPQAIHAYQCAIEKDPFFLPTRLNLAHAYTRNGDLLEAEKTYFSCLDLTTQDTEQADIWTQLGQLYENTDRQEASQNAYRKAETLRELTKPKEKRTEEADNPQAPLEIDLDTVKAKAAQPAHPPFAQIRTENIYINPRQPRMRIDVENLVESVREHGVIQPIIVSPNGDEEHYILVSGHRRLKAARQVGLETIPAIIRDVNEREQLELALTENLQRLNLSSLEQADAYAQLRDEFELTPEEIARRMGRSSITIQNLLSQLSLPERIKRALDVGRIQDGHASAILKLDDPAKQLNAFEQVLQRDLSVRKTEALVRLLNLEVRHEFETIAEDARHQEEPVAFKDEPVITQKKLALSETNPLIARLPSDTKTEEAKLEPDDDTSTPNDTSEAVFANFRSEHDNDAPIQLDGEPGTTETLPTESWLIEVAKDGDATTTDDMLAPLVEQSTSSPSNIDAQQMSISEENTVAQKSNDEEALKSLAENYSLRGENQKAIETYQKALLLSSQTSYYYDKLGHLYIASKQYAEATHAFEQALALNNDGDLYIHCALAGSYRRLGLSDKAQVHIEIAAPQMLKETPYNRACFEAICGNVVQAIELLEIALKDAETTIQKIEQDHDFDFIRQEELFSEFLREKTGVAHIIG